MTYFRERSDHRMGFHNSAEWREEDMGSDTRRNSPVDLCQEERTRNLWEIQKRHATVWREVSGSVPEKPRRKEDCKEEGGTRKGELEKEKWNKWEKGKTTKTGLHFMSGNRYILGTFLCRELKYAVTCLSEYVSAPTRLHYHPSLQQRCNKMKEIKEQKIELK